MTGHLLTLVVFAPLALAGVVAVLPGGERGQLKAATLVAMLVSFGLTVALYLAFDPDGAQFQFEVSRPWIPAMGIGYHLGADGLSVSLMLLTGFLGPLVVLASWRSVQARVKEFCLSLLVLQSAMLGVFCALDLALFYVFWEAMLVPMYLLIGVWGSENRVYAAVKFFLYTFAASVLMLLAILYLYVKSGPASSRSFDYPAILAALQQPGALGWEARRWLFLAFALAFAVKVPLFPLHTWLPDAHVEAPAAGSIILAGVLLKMGVFGFLRFAMPFFPDAAAYFRPAIAVLAVIGIVYGSLMSFVQKDLKKLVAYSSVAHLGFVMLGVMAASAQAVSGAILQMLNHGVSTGALFLLIGIVYERTHTRAIADYGGIARITPMYAGAFLVILLSSIGLPGTNGFVGEFLILSGTFLAPFDLKIAAPAGVTLPSMETVALSSIAASGVLLSAVYMLRMYQQVMLGPVRHAENRKLADLDLREWCAVGPLLAVAIGMGVFPQPFLRRIEPSSKAFASQMGSLPASAALAGTGTGIETEADAAPAIPAPRLPPSPQFERVPAPAGVAIPKGQLRDLRPYPPRPPPAAGREERR